MFFGGFGLGLAFGSYWWDPWYWGGPSYYGYGYGYPPYPPASYYNSYAPAPPAAAAPAPAACGTWSWDPAGQQYHWIPCGPAAPTPDDG